MQLIWFLVALALGYLFVAAFTVCWVAYFEGLTFGVFRKRAIVPNDLKLSDGGAWRGACPTVARTDDAPNVADAPLAESTRRDTRSCSLQRMVPGLLAGCAAKQPSGLGDGVKLRGDDNIIV